MRTLIFIWLMALAVAPVNSGAGIFSWDKNTTPPWVMKLPTGEKVCVGKVVDHMKKKKSMISCPVREGQMGKCPSAQICYSSRRYQ